MRPKKENEKKIGCCWRQRPCIIAGAGVDSRGHVTVFALEGLSEGDALAALELALLTLNPRASRLPVA